MQLARGRLVLHWLWGHYCRLQQRHERLQSPVLHCCWRWPPAPWLELRRRQLAVLALAAWPLLPALPPLTLLLALMP